MVTKKKNMREMEVQSVQLLLYLKGHCYKVKTYIVKLRATTEEGVREKEREKILKTLNPKEGRKNE
jgi:pyrroloquinoline quinone (PQQ) biosynthesis protein C